MQGVPTDLSVRGDAFYYSRMWSLLEKFAEEAGNPPPYGTVWMRMRKITSKGGKEMKKKRMPALLLGCLLTAGLTACGGPQADPENDPSAQLPNPMVAYEDARFPDYEITGYPDREGMTPTAFYLIGGALAEIDYENAVLRVDGITENERDISGLYLTDPPVESELTVPHSCCDRLIGVTVKQYTEGTLAAWDSCGDPFTWTLWLPGQTAEQARALIEEVVADVLVRMPDAGESLAAP